MIVNRPRLRKRLRSRRGQTAVETAIILSVLFTLVLGIYEYGRLVMIKQLMGNASREGARQAVVNTSTMTTAQIQTTVTGFLAGQSYNNLAIQVYQADPTTGNNIGVWTGAPFGSTIAVQVDLYYAPITPVSWGLPGALHMTSKSLMRSEAN